MKMLLWHLFSGRARGQGEILLRLPVRTHRSKKERSKAPVIQEEAEGQSRKRGHLIIVQG